MDALAKQWVASMDVVMLISGLVARNGRYHDLGMDAVANERAGSRDIIMVWAWMHLPMDGLVEWVLSWPGHGCAGQRVGW